MQRAVGLFDLEHGMPGDGQMCGNLLEAMAARHFLDQVLLDGDVEAVRGCRDHEGVEFFREGEIQAPEDCRDLLGCDSHADHAGRPGYTHADRSAHGHRDAMIVDRTRDTAADLKHKVRDALEVLDGRLGIDATLEAMCSISREIEAPGPSLDGLGPPERGFHVDVGGLEGHGRRIAAHDASQTLDRLAVGDDADVSIERDRRAVEQLQGFARRAPTHLESAMDLLQIEDMGRAPQFEHDVVGDIHQRADAALAAAGQALLHPLGGGRTRIHAADDAP